jgi:citrate synthase
VLALLRTFPKDADPMAALRTAVSALGMFDPEADDNSDEANRRKAIRLTAKIPTIIAAFDRIRKGQGAGGAARRGWIPRPTSSTCSTARRRTSARAHLRRGAGAPRRARDERLHLLRARHGGTQSDIYSAVVSAIGTLKGPLARRRQRPRDADAARDRRERAGAGGVGARALERGERVMGFGHRVYKATDPRATVLRELADQIMPGGETRWLDLSDRSAP